MGGEMKTELLIAKCSSKPVAKISAKSLHFFLLFVRAMNDYPYCICTVPTAGLL
jgi:hypothetical protein